MICPASGRTKISFVGGKIGWVFANKRKAHSGISPQDNCVVMHYIKSINRN